MCQRQWDDPLFNCDFLSFGHAFHQCMISRLTIRVHQRNCTFYGFMVFLHFVVSWFHIFSLCLTQYAGLCAFSIQAVPRSTFRINYERFRMKIQLVTCKMHWKSWILILTHTYKRLQIERIDSFWNFSRKCEETEKLVSCMEAQSMLEYDLTGHMWAWLSSQGRLPVSPPPPHAHSS